jgi:glycosyltransferase involved in cell wall biosynthesis
MNHLKILIFNDYAYAEGGAGKVAVESAKKLAEKDHEVIFFSAVGPVSKGLLESKIKEIICLGQKDLLNSSNKLGSMISGINNFQAEKKIRELLSKWRPDIAHFHGVSKALSWVPISVVNSYGIPTVYTLHDFGLLCPNMALYDFRAEKQCFLYEDGKALKCLLTNCDKRNYAQKLWRYFRFHYTKDIIKIFNKIDGFIAVSDTVKDIYRSFIPAGKEVRVINNPVKYIDSSIISKTVPKTGNYMTTFLYVGRLSAEKGVDLLIEAIKEVDARLMIAGSGEMDRFCRDAEGKVGKGKIKVLGWKDENEIHDLMMQCDVIALPSKVKETSGIVIKEAAGYCMPSIVPDQGGVTEFVADEVNGLFFKSGNKSSLVKTMQRFVDDTALSRKLGAEARKSYEEYYDKALKYVEYLEEFYKEIIKDKD